MRTTSKFLIAAFAGVALFATGASALNKGDACDNSNTNDCVSGTICIANKCQDSTNVPDSSRGSGNKCSATDCCVNDWKCLNVDGGRCGPSNGLVSTIDCGSATSTSTDAPSTPDTPSIPDTPSSPVSTDAPSSPDTPSSPNTPNIPNAPNAPSSPISSVPNIPASPVGIPSSPVSTDVPNIPSSPVSTDLPSTPNTPSIPDIPSSPVSTDVPNLPGIPGAVAGLLNIQPGEYCGNFDACVTGYDCNYNKCTQRTDISTFFNGYGNKCDATNCCRTELVCNKALAICLPNVSQLETVQCTAPQTGASQSGSDQTQSPTSSDPVNGGSASGSSAASTAAFSLGLIGSLALAVILA